jgi:undecaprenyl-diphosphatase
MAFTGFLFLSYFAKKQGLKILCFVLALLVGISRIYNGQHFPEDVLFGSLLGAILSYLIYTFVPTYHLKSVSKQQ